MTETKRPTDEQRAVIAAHLEALHIAVSSADGAVIEWQDRTRLWDELRMLYSRQRPAISSLISLALLQETPLTLEQLAVPGMKLTFVKMLNRLVREARERPRSVFVEPIDANDVDVPQRIE